VDGSTTINQVDWKRSVLSMKGQVEYRRNDNDDNDGGYSAGLGAWAANRTALARELTMTFH